MDSESVVHICEVYPVKEMNSYKTHFLDLSSGHLETWLHTQLHELASFLGLPFSSSFPLS